VLVCKCVLTVATGVAFASSRGRLCRCERLIREDESSSLLVAAAAAAACAQLAAKLVSVNDFGELASSAAPNLGEEATLADFSRHSVASRTERTIQTTTTTTTTTNSSDDNNNAWAARPVAPARRRQTDKRLLASPFAAAAVIAHQARSLA
jgi:hypothetical protein